jgi:hypothetical protein
MGEDSRENNDTRYHSDIICVHTGRSKCSKLYIKKGGGLSTGPWKRPLLALITTKLSFHFFQQDKIKLSLYRPWRPLGLLEVAAPTFSDIRLIDCGKDVSPTDAGLYLPPGKFLVLIPVRGWVDPRVIVRLEELGKLKKSTSSGTRTATFRLVAWRLKPTTLPLAPHFLQCIKMTGEPWVPKIALKTLLKLYGNITTCTVHYLLKLQKMFSL